MKDEILKILADVSKGEKSPETAQKEILDIFSTTQQRYSIVRWYNNEYEDVVCVDKETAEDYVKKYNNLAGIEKCYVDDTIWYPLIET